MQSCIRSCRVAALRCGAVDATLQRRPQSDGAGGGVPPTPAQPPPAGGGGAVPPASGAGPSDVVTRGEAAAPAKELHQSKLNLTATAPNVVGDTGFDIEFDETALTQRQRDEMALKHYDPKNVYSRVDNEGNSSIMFKYNPPDNPTAHQEGHILDFSDGVASSMQSNPFGDLAAEAKAGKIEGVAKHSLAIPGSKQRSLYGFERRNKYELTNYGRSTDYISALPAEIEAGDVLQMAMARLPGFDPTRESLYDKAALRYYKERRDLRLLERDAVMHERKLAEYQSENQLSAAYESRRVIVRDMVMQSGNKWLALKFNETEEAYVRQNEDVQYSNFIRNHIARLMVAFAAVLAYHRIIEDGSLENSYILSAGECSAISGQVGRSHDIGSWKQVGDMYKFQNQVERARLQGLDGLDGSSRLSRADIELEYSLDPSARGSRGADMVAL